MLRRRQPLRRAGRSVNRQQKSRYPHRRRTRQNKWPSSLRRTIRTSSSIGSWTRRETSMRWFSGIILIVFMTALAAPAIAQNDICAQGTSKESGDQARAEQLRIQASEQAARVSWAIKMFTVKNLEGRNNYGAL